VVIHGRSDGGHSKGITSKLALIERTGESGTWIALRGDGLGCAMGLHAVTLPVGLTVVSAGV
jgi:hypothetical protein